MLNILSLNLHDTPLIDIADYFNQPSEIGNVPHVILIQQGTASLLTNNIKQLADLLCEKRGVKYHTHIKSISITWFKKLKYDYIGLLSYYQVMQTDFILLDTSFIQWANIKVPKYGNILIYNICCKNDKIVVIFRDSIHKNIKELNPKSIIVGGHAGKAEEMLKNCRFKETNGIHYDWYTKICSSELLFNGVLTRILI